MGELKIRPKHECRYDAVALGEVMLRLDPGDMRIRTARSFQVWEGGGEYNVVRGLSRVFGLETSIITSLVDDEVGHLVEGLVLAGGVDTSWITWKASDGIGRRTRNGLNFTERGFGVRGAKGVSDRGHTAVSQLSESEIDFDRLFGEQGVRWLHTGGIYAGLSETSARTCLAALKAAHKHGTVVSYDLNYRPSLWKTIGGQARAQEFNREIAEFVDVMIGNEEDFTAGLGLKVEGVDDNLTHLPLEGYRAMIEQAVRKYPNLAVVATTLRTVHSASLNDWGALGWSSDTGFVEATTRKGLEIFDRVGGGDSFASGLISELLQGNDVADAVECGAAHGALAMTTPGDTSMASAAEVHHLASGGSARVDR